MAWATSEAHGLRHWIDSAAYYRATCGVDMIRADYGPSDKPKCGVCVETRTRRSERQKGGRRG